MKNALLVDWFTFSFRDCFDVEEAFKFLKLKAVSFENFSEENGRYFYKTRYSFKGIHILSHGSYYDGVHDQIIPMGICIEMSGEGCRTFDTFSEMSFEELIRKLTNADGSKNPLYNISRIDFAFDTSKENLPIEKVAQKVLSGDYKGLPRWYNVMQSTDGITVYLGHKSSSRMLRFYDKKGERQAHNRDVSNIDSWIRCELVLKEKNIYDFCHTWFETESIGMTFFSFVSDFITFLNHSNKNKYRRSVCQWWIDFLGDVCQIERLERKDREYNLDMLRWWTVDNMNTALNTYISIVGFSTFIEELIHFHKDKRNPKYIQLLEEHGVHDDYELEKILSSFRYDNEDDDPDFELPF